MAENVKSIFFVTSSDNKLREMQKLLAPFPVRQFLTHGSPIDCDEIQELDPTKIIQAKIAYIMQQFPDAEFPFIVEDTGLYCYGLGSEPQETISHNYLPGPLVKWFFKAVGPAGLCRMVTACGNNKAYAQTIIAYAASPTSIVYFEGSVHGTIVPCSLYEGFGFDPIFQPDGALHTFSAMTLDEKNRWSHRARAVSKLKEWLMEKL